MAADKIRMLFDLNILLDVLQERPYFYDSSARLLADTKTVAIKGRAAAQSIPTLFYLTAKGASLEQARVTRTSILQFLRIRRWMRARSSRR